MKKPAPIQNVYCMQYVDALLAQQAQANSAINRSQVAARAGCYPASLHHLGTGTRKSHLPIYGKGYTYDGIAKGLGVPWVTAGDIAAAGGVSLLDAPIIRASVNGGPVQALTLAEAVYHNGCGDEVVWPRCPCASEWEKYLSDLGAACFDEGSVAGIREGLLALAPLEDWALVAPLSEFAILQAPAPDASLVTAAFAPPHRLDAAPAHAYAEHLCGDTFDPSTYWAHVSCYAASASYFQRPCADVTAPEAALYYLVQNRRTPMRVLPEFRVIRI